MWYVLCIILCAAPRLYHGPRGATTIHPPAGRWNPAGQGFQTCGKVWWLSRALGIFRLDVHGPAEGAGSRIEVNILAQTKTWTPRRGRGALADAPWRGRGIRSGEFRFVFAPCSPSPRPVRGRGKLKGEFFFVFHLTCLEQPHKYDTLTDGVLSSI